MKAVTEVKGTGVALRRSDVDTDQIIPSEWLKRVERTGFGRGLFSEWREDPAFVLNQPQYQGAKVLVAGPRFGTGSSREHAVWALMDYGFEAVIAPSFGDIFRNNSSKQGLVIVQLSPEAVEDLQKMIEDAPQTQIVVDVQTLEVTLPELNWRSTFAMDPITQERLLQGWDDIGLTLRQADSISEYESKHASHGLNSSLREK